MNFWCEIKKKLLIENVNKIKLLTSKNVMGIVKGNAYGLGIEDITAIIDSHVDCFGVATYEEATLIDTKKDILIMSPICSIPAEDIKSNYIFTIDSEEDLSLFSDDKEYRVHIYVNTGMNRLGISPSSVDILIKNITYNYPNIKIEGIYTHLHNAGNVVKSKQQIEILKDLYNRYSNLIPNFHCLNSKGILSGELQVAASFCNIVRAGNLLYGYDGLSSGFKRVFEIKAKIVKSYIIKESSFVGYGEKFKVNPGTKIGVLPCGSIDKIGYIKNIKSSLIKDILKPIRSRINEPIFGYYNDKPVYTVCSPNMNCSLIDITSVGADVDDIISVNMSSLLMDSGIMKLYI